MSNIDWIGLVWNNNFLGLLRLGFVRSCVAMIGPFGFGINDFCGFEWPGIARFGRVDK